ncbi:hypothetical protein H7F50_08380 [Novosphingobium flavum]|uniref:SH3 domain-containing protein n=1 Tax=Novosphingobium aerophilum TaxID=2839843 RepID=A0A7X1KDI4_9SPHN|nr:hypothetical protein [Novosphingobium aerophilum]MBC2653182.1 hypothetical protein [Novosphingobium aerophilum]MBC2661773.1 hypothetical protein [Novosphingobium aerophilum]
MTKTILFLAAAALLAAPAQAAPRLTPEQQLAKAIEGRVAGKPVSCIDPRLNANSRVIDRTAIIYGSGRTIYVQQPANASALRSDDILLTELVGTTQLCNIDMVRLIDRNGFWFRGFVNLNPFVPYTRAEATHRE